MNIAGKLTQFSKKNKLVSMLMRVARKSLNEMGLDLVRYIGPRDDLDLYHRLFDHSVLERKPFYNIGAGSFYHPYWTNIDFKTDWYQPNQEAPFIEYDLMQLLPLPLPDSSAQVMYTSHTIEHVTDDAVQNLFNEVHRCLEPGGFFRITTGPDAEANTLALLRGDEAWFHWDDFYSQPGTYEDFLHKPANEAPLPERWIHQQATQLAPNDKSPSKAKISAPEIRRILNEKTLEDALEYFASFCAYQKDRPGNHISWWTHMKIAEFLERAGFREIYRSGYGQSRSPLMRNTDLFDKTYPEMSCYMEAMK